MTERKMSTNWQKLQGALYCFLALTSCFIGFFYMYCPILPLLLFNRKLFRKITDICFTAWESYNVTILEVIFGVQTFIAGDQFRPEENSLILLNHRTRNDWNFMWSALLHATQPMAHNAKFVLKEDVKILPGPGWVMQFARFLYISRNWKKDEVRIAKQVEYLGKHSADQPYQLVLFPEGTNLTPSNQEKSRIFGEKNNLKPLNYLLQPRTTGFTYLVQQMRQHGGLHAVYDVTIAYPDETPVNEKDLLDGKFPNEVHFHIKRYGDSALPTTFIGLEKWLQELWRDKDQLLETVYKERVRMPLSSARQNGPQKTIPLQYVSLVAWGCLTLKILQILLTTWSPFHWLWIVFFSTFQSLISYYTNGLQDIEAALDKELTASQFYTAFMNMIFRRKRD